MKVLNLVVFTCLYLLLSVLSCLYLAFICLDLVFFVFICLYLSSAAFVCRESSMFVVFVLMDLFCRTSLVDLNPVVLDRRKKALIERIP